jgi:hypothetical protein
MYRRRAVSTMLLASAFAACSIQRATPPPAPTPAEPTLRSYFTPDTGLDTAGVRLVPIATPKGKFNVWTKRFGRNPRIRLLLLHGGPGATHEYFEALEHALGEQVKHGSFLLCPNGSHLAMWDDQGTYTAGLVRFLKEVDAGKTQVAF